ncbi:nucleotide/sugar transporter family protein [Striga asiatica]|uniref:Nucleotide/sugar transporter family protein n=1 Tax=Striga asiatica TaxID=4170 RepID=A0A5A7RH51_STRAF|nr:nucleotide/sugar transporter family protein [Striga asiatica]
MEHMVDTDITSTNGLRNQNKSYVPLDIENDHTIPTFRKTAKNVISVADLLKTLFFILVWYTFSTFLTLYNKTLLGDKMGKFPAPLLMNTVHFTMQAVLSKAITWFWSDRFHPSVMSWKDYFVRGRTNFGVHSLSINYLHVYDSCILWPLPVTVVPTALSTAMDVNLSNASLVFISVTFATMCKSASPIFLLLFAFAFRLESPSVKLLGIILVISVGILLTVAKETEFEFWGFIFVTLAAVMSGFRWTMTQILLQSKVPKCNDPTSLSSISRIKLFTLIYFSLVLHQSLQNPLTLMSYVTPVMAIATALLSLMLDPWQEFRASDYFNSSWHTAKSCLLMLFGGTLAFVMVLTEYILVSVTSAVTVTIAGVVKEAVTILVAVLYFHDEFTWLKGVGLLTIMVGVSLFNWYKYEKLQKGESVGSPADGATPTYVILDEMDEEEDRT